MFLGLLMLMLLIANLSPLENVCFFSLSRIPEIHCGDLLCNWKRKLYNHKDFTVSLYWISINVWIVKECFNISLHLVLLTWRRVSTFPYMLVPPLTWWLKSHTSALCSMQNNVATTGKSSLITISISETPLFSCLAACYSSISP